MATGTMWLPFFCSRPPSMRLVCYLIVFTCTVFILDYFAYSYHDFYLLRMHQALFSKFSEICTSFYFQVLSLTLSACLTLTSCPVLPFSLQLWTTTVSSEFARIKATLISVPASSHHTLQFHSRSLFPRFLLSERKKKTTKNRNVLLLP